MTETEILSMQAGRELDALVHQKVMGKKAVYIAEKPFILEEDPSSPLGIRCNFGGAVFTRDREWLVNDYYDPDARVGVPDYSRDISAAWEVVKYLCAAGYRFSIFGGGSDESIPGISCGWFVIISHRLRPWVEVYVKDAELPCALCKAALLVYEQEAVKQDV